MPVNSTARKYLSDVVKGANTFDNANAMQFNYDAVTVTSAFTVEVIGIPVVWDTSAGVFVIYTDATFAELALAIAAGDSPLPGGAVIAVLVGDGQFGVGFNSADINFTSGASAVALHRGANNAGVVRSGLDYSTATTSAGNQATFEAQLETQGVMVIDNATVISPTFTS